MWANQLTGIYAIYNHATGEAYIGRSLHIAARWQSHLVALQSNRHNNKARQAAHVVYGSSAFGLVILERVNIPNELRGVSGLRQSSFGLDRIEQAWCARARAAGIVLYNDQVGKGRRKAA